MLAISAHEFGTRLKNNNDVTAVTSNVLSEYLVKRKGINVKQERQCTVRMT
jgi:hypothetical protein